MGIVCIIVFMYIVSLKIIIIISIKRVFFRFLSILFLIFEKGMSKNIAPGIFRFVSMLSLIFEKAMSKRNCARNFKIRKYTFFNI